jgi:hypothetical protein
MCADFATLNFEVNTGTNATPTWTNLSVANAEVRWWDQATAGANVAQASWPATIRPTSGTAQIAFTYAYPAPATGGLGFIGGGTATPATYAIANSRWARWNWSGEAGSGFASAPIFTAYLTTSHGAITRGVAAGGQNMLEGSADTTNVSAFSYLKGNAYGQLNGAADATQPPAGTPLPNAPLVASGTTNSVSPTAGANWLAQFQSLQGDNDYITFPSIPAAATADKWSVHFALFTGVNMLPGTMIPVISLKYTFS